MERNTRSYPRPALRVIQAVAASTDTDPLELPPLYDRLDSDALDAVVRGLDNGTVQFRYVGHTVTVHSDGSVEITDGSATGCEQSNAAADD